MNKNNILGIVLASLATLTLTTTVLAKQVTLLNVSYDPTRELYDEYNQAFSKHWHSLTENTVKVNQSHGGSGKQARSVIDGLDADIVTLALAYDIDSIAEKTGLLPTSWQSKLPDNSSPYTSTIVFLVRKGNPKNIQDWDDLVKPGVSVITPNPKTSGGARWNYLAAWGYALNQWNNDEPKAFEFVKAIFKNTPVLDSGARGSTTTFVERGVGDVLITWENEAYLAIKEFGENKFEIIVPSISILAEPPVAVIEKNAVRHGREKLAYEYLKYLYSPEGQAIVAKHFYRPRNKQIAQQYTHTFKPIKLFTIDSAFGGWQAAQKNHFADRGTFDQIYEN